MVVLLVFRSEEGDFLFCISLIYVFVLYFCDVIFFLLFVKLR